MCSVAEKTGEKEIKWNAHTCKNAEFNSANTNSCFKLCGVFVSDFSGNRYPKVQIFGFQFILLFYLLSLIKRRIKVIRLCFDQ